MAKKFIFVKKNDGGDCHNLSSSAKGSKIFETNKHHYRTSILFHSTKKQQQQRIDFLIEKRPKGMCLHMEHIFVKKKNKEKKYCLDAMWLKWNETFLLLFLLLFLGNCVFFWNVRMKKKCWFYTSNGVWMKMNQKKWKKNPSIVTWKVTK